MLSIFRETLSLEGEGEGGGGRGRKGEGGGVKGFVREIPSNHFCHQIEFTGPLPYILFFACYVPPLNKQLIERLLMSLVNLAPFFSYFLTITSNFITILPSKFYFHVNFSK
jgi:hypothetical protein